MDGVDATLYRGGNTAAHPSSPIDFAVDAVHARQHLSSSVNSLSASAARQTASPRPPLPQQQQQQQQQQQRAAPLQDVVPEEEELDQFDIVLQQDAVASTTQFAGTHSPSGATPPLLSSSLHNAAAAAPSVGYHSSATPGTANPNSLSSPSALQQSASKLMSSVAGVCQASAITQDRDQCARLIHQMTSILRGEINLHGHATAATSSSGTGGTAAAAAAAPGATRSATASVVASPGGDPRATSSPATQIAAAASATAVSAHNFEEELSLLTDIILEANLAHNPQWSASLHRGANGYVSPLHTTRGSPRSAGGVAQPAVGGATQQQQQHGGSANAARSHSRTSPAGNGAYASVSHVSPTAGAVTAASDGRSTIDTEVSDSLCRLSRMGGGGGTHHHLYTMEHEVRPMNPCQVAAAGGSGASSRQASSALPVSHPPPASSASWSSLMYGSGSVGHLDRAAIASLTSQQSSRRGNGSAGRSTSATVKHPRAVKPDPRNDLAKVGRIRGPRSRTGKNVAPSNHSAFSECSGGETRSCRSTLTGANRVLSSSANATTNTSMSSSLFNHIQVEHTLAATGGDRRE